MANLPLADRPGQLPDKLPDSARKADGHGQGSIRAVRLSAPVPREVIRASPC